MDPFSITTAILPVTKACFTTAKSLYDIRNEYKDAPTTITSMCSETTVISASLSQLQHIVLRKNDLEATLLVRPELASALDCSIIGCTVVFSCLKEEMAQVKKGMRDGQPTTKSKAKLVCNKDKLRELLEDLRGQQTALSTLIALLQVETIAEIKSLLKQHQKTFEKTARRTLTLRKSNPSISIRTPT